MNLCHADLRIPSLLGAEDPLLEELEDEVSAELVIVSIGLLLNLHKIISPLLAKIHDPLCCLIIHLFC